MRSLRLNGLISVVLVCFAAACGSSGSASNDDSPGDSGEDVKAAGKVPEGGACLAAPIYRKDKCQPGLTCATVGGAAQGTCAGSDGGAASATASDGGTASDGSSNASASGGTACGTAFCRGGQTCVADACVYENCVGSQVPGDYATIRDALLALAPVGGTICLGATTYKENIPEGWAPFGAPLTLSGVSATQTHISGPVALSSSANVTIKGIDFDGGSQIALEAATTATLTIEGSSFHGSHWGGALRVNASTAVISAVTANNGGQGPAIAIVAGVNASPISATIDESDLSGPSQNGAGSAAVAIEDELEHGGEVKMLVQNSYLHDAFAGAAFKLTSSKPFTIGDALTLENNTIMRTGTGLYVPPEVMFDTTTTTPLIAAYNNLFVDNGVAVGFMDSGSGYPPNYASGNDLFFGNTTNFSGPAKDGSGDVKTDPLLDGSSTPPTLKAGSSAKGAGDPAHAPDHDYWGRPRGASADIGAVRSQ